ncbi:Ig-like domain-containing protein [Haloprofundus salilacus]|uniref:Ig-like domain-containing protein n=1 Tax=Haloprofundus salilacus TaxID=2876190 RepID=UPI001CCFF764|nr:Ig-like domain-containing protein [Haloprofundus salilacus]
MSRSLNTDGAAASAGTQEWPTLDSDDWSTAGRDPGRSGYNPNSSGPKTGAESRWVYEAENQSQTEPAVVADGRVFVPTREGLQVLDNETGETVWNDTDLNVQHVAVSDGIAVAVSSWTDDEIRAYDAVSGTELWNETDFEAESSVILNGTLYVERTLYQGHYLYAFDLQNGTELWYVNYADDAAGGIAASGDTVYVTGWLSDSFDRERAVYALNASNGEERWRFEVEGHIEMNPVVANGTVYVGAGDEESFGGETYDPKFYALNETDGHLEWIYDAHVRPNGAAVADGSVFVSMGNGIHALDAATGERQWVHRMAGDVDYGLTYTTMNTNPPAVADGVVYATNDRGFVYALDGDTGTVHWSSRVEGRATDPAVADGRVYIHATVGESGANVVRVYALETPPFLFSGLGASTMTPTPGELVTVDVTVENLDDEPRDYDLSLMADSPLHVDWWEEDSATGTLNAGDSTTVTFEGRFNTTGEWNLSVKRTLESDPAIGPLTVEVSHTSQVDDWPTWKFDGGLTGSNPDAVAPKRHLQERWNVTDLNRDTRPVVQDGTTYVVHSEYRSGQNNIHSLAAYDLETGDEEWKFNVSAYNRLSAGSATVHDGTVYLYTTPFNFDGEGAGNDGTVFALNASDGSLEWRHETSLNRSVPNDQAPIVADGTVYVAGGTFEPHTDLYSNGSVLALNAADGAVKWEYERAERGTTELFYGVAAVDGSVYATLQNEEWVDSSRVHYSDLVALDAAGGSMRWSTESRPFNLDTTEQPVVRGNLVYVINRTSDSAGDTTPELHAISVSDGSEQWRYTSPSVGHGWRLHDPVVTEDAVFLRQRELGSGLLYDTSYLYRLDAASGTLEWNRSTPYLATLLAVDGLLYGGEGDDEPTHVYDAVTGEKYGATDATTRASGTVQTVANGTMLTVEESGQPLRALVEGGAFEFTDLKVDSERVGIGENVTVTATVTNVGELTRTWNANLRVSPDSSRQSHHIWNYPSRSGTLAPGESETATWTVELREGDDFVFTLQPNYEDTGMNRYLYDRTTGVTASAGDERDGSVISLGGPRDLTPDANSWPKESFDAGNTGNNTGTGAPTAVGADVASWSVNHSYEWTSGPTLANETVFVGGNHVSGGEFVYAYDAADGALRWQYQTYLSRDVEVPPTYAGGYLYTADSDGRVYQFNAATGERLWTYGVGDVGGITVVDDVAYVAGSDYDDSYFGLVHALNATTREVLWTFERDSSYYGMNVKPAVVDGTVYVTSDDGYTYALNATTGEEVWNRPITGTGSRLHSPVVEDGVVYVDDAAYGDTDGRIYALDATDGNTLWSTPANVDGYTGSSPVLANDTLYFTADGVIQAINANNGNQRWATAVCTAARHSPVYADGIVYVPTTDSAIRAYDANTGELVWRYDAYSETAFTPAVVGGTLYATGLENSEDVYSLVALEGGTTDAAKTSFTYSGLSVSSLNVSTGEAFTVSATVENQGSVDCAYTADLEVDESVVDSTTGSVSSGSSDTVEFTHTFSSTGTYNVSIEGLPPVEVTVTEPVAVPVVEPTTRDFGDVEVGSSTDRFVQVTNEGTETLYLDSASITGTNADEFSILSGPQTNVYPGDSATIWLRFAPTSTGAKTATLEVETYFEGTVTATLTGTSAGPAKVDVSPTAVDFGDVEVGNTSTADVTVSNVGGSPLSFDGAQLSGTNAGMYTVTNGGTTTIAAGDSHTVTVEFAPTATGPTTATLELSTNDADDPTVDVALSGDGIITEPNRPPVVAADHYVVTAGETLTVSTPGLLVNDLDPDGDALDVAHYGTPDNGTLNVVTDGSLTYTPDSGFTGTDSFVYRVQDEEGEYSSYATVTIDIVEENRVPEAIDDHYSVHAGETLLVGAPGRLENDRDPDGDSIIASHQGSPSHGTLHSSTTSGSFEYEPDPGFTGTDSFEYRVQDEHGEYSWWATVTVDVLPPQNREPVAVSDAYSVSQGDTLVIDAPGRLANDYDLDGDSIIASHQGSPSHGTLHSSTTSGSFEYEPDPGFSGIDSFDYRVQDEHGKYSWWATVTIEVAADNTEPVAVADHYATLKGENLTVGAPGRLTNDYDLDGDSIIASHQGSPSHGTLHSSTTAGSFLYEPDPGFTGTDSFDYRVQDDRGEYSWWATVTVEVVDPAETSPVAMPDNYTVYEGETLTVNAPGRLANDVDPDDDSIIASHQGSPSNGTLVSATTSGSFEYEPNPGFTGTDSFVYRIEDDSGNISSWTTVTIEVLPDPDTAGNRAPTAVADTYSIFQGETLTVSAPGRVENDYDPDGDSIIASHQSSPSHGTLHSSTTSGSFEYEPDPGFSGIDSFDYRVQDEHGEYSWWATVTIEVVPNPNRDPETTDDHYSVYEGETLSVSGPGLLVNDADSDGDAIDVTHYGSPDNGTLTVASDGSFEYEPDPGFTGTDSFDYRVQDDHGAYSWYATATVDVLPDPNRAPDVAPDYHVVLQGETLSVSAPGLLANDYDLDDDSLDVRHYGNPSHGTLSVVSDGSFTYTPDPDFTGTDSFVYRIQDEHGADSSFESVTVTVVDASVSGFADVAVAQDSVDFGTIPAGTNVTATVTIANVGDENLTFSDATILEAGGAFGSTDGTDTTDGSTLDGGSLSFSGSEDTDQNGSAFAVTAGNTATELGYGATHTLTVEFAPTNVGSANATLMIQTNDPDEPTVIVLLTGDSYDDTGPTVDAVNVNGSYHDGTAVYANETVEISVNATDEFGTVDDVRVTLDSQSSTYRVTDVAAYNATTGNWTVEFDGDDVIDDGRYDVIVTARDDVGNRVDTIAPDKVDFDRAPPSLAATVSRVNATAANVSVNATESLRPGALAVDVEHPDGTIETVSVTNEGGHWNGTFDLPANGQYNVTVTALDLTGNRGTDRARALFANESTDANNTITVQMQPSGLFVRFTTDQPVNDTSITMTESNVALEPLVRGQAGVRFLNAVPGERLSDNMTYAVIGIPVDESLLTHGTDVDDVTIRYFNETTRQWSDVPTTVENVSVNGTSDQYWIANVTHFSTYGAVASDTTPPAVTATTPTDNHEFASGTSSATLTVEYEDALSGVDASRTVVLFDDALVTTDSATTVTGDYAEFEATGLTDGSSHTLEVTVEDQAGNSHTETVSFTVDTVSSDGGNSQPDNDDSSSQSDDDDSTSQSNGNDQSDGSTGEGDDQPTAPRASIDSAVLGDESFVFRIRDTSANETLSATVENGTIGTTGVTLERLTVTVNAGGDSDLEVIGGATPTESPALSTGQGTVLTYLDVTNASTVDATLQLSVRRDVLKERGVDPIDVVGYHLVDGSWRAVTLTQVNATDDVVVYEANFSGLTGFALATNAPEESTTTTEAPLTETETTAEPTPTTISATTTDTPGFGLGLTLLSLLAVVSLFGRRHNREKSTKK